MKRFMPLFMLAAMAILLLMFTKTETIAHFVRQVKSGGLYGGSPDWQTDSDAIPVMSETGLTSRPQKSTNQLNRTELLELIKQEAAKRYIPPVNARLDSVWKAIPGYNGLEVDIERTYKLALQKGNRSPIPFVYKEIPPEISLEQLGPQPIYKGNPDKKMIALMINVAWGNEYIPSILDTLRKENVHATFFFDGSWLKKNEETAKLIMAEGHEMSNHGYSHKDMSTLSAQQAREEIAKTQQLLSNLKVENRLFAPPSGDFDAETVQIAHEYGLKTILWTIDTIDWKKPDPSVIIRKIKNRLEPGAFILMHPTSSTSLALPEIIKEIKRRGWHAGTVGDALSPMRLPPVETPGVFW